MLEKGWIALRDASETPQKAVREGSEDALVVVNHSKYHRTQEPEKVPTRPNQTEPNIYTAPDGADTPSNSKEKRAASKETNPDIKLFIDFWCESYQSKFGDTYLVAGGKDGGTVKRLLGGYSLERLKDLAGRFLNKGDEWVKTNGGYTIGIFASQINKLVSTMKSEQPRREIRKIYERG